MFRCRTHQEPDLILCFDLLTEPDLILCDDLLIEPDLILCFDFFRTRLSHSMGRVTPPSVR